jgi:O-antigen/teichoic acid export membrane protein/glycosyltransferase involved in cell wall biosynthesis
MSSGSSDHRLRSSVGWMFIGQCSGYVLRVVYFILIARALGVVEYGAVAAAFAFVSLGAQYSRLGSGMVLLRYVSADRPQFSVYWGNVLATTLAASGIITLVFTLVAPHILDAKSVGLVAFTAAASCVFEQITISTTQVFQAFQRMGFTAGLNLLTSLFRTIAAAGLLLTVHHATAKEWVILSMIVSALAAAIGVTAVTVCFGRPTLDLRVFRSRAGEGIEYAFAASTNSAYDDLDKTMLSHFGMTAAVGIYAMAYRVIEMATVPITSIQLAVEPRQFALGEEGVLESAALGKRLLSKSVLLSLATAAILFVAAPVLPLLVGKNFSESVSALRWLCLIPLFRSVHHLTGSVLTCSGKQRLRTANQLATAAFNFLLNLWMIPRFGWVGAAWASLLSDGVLGLMNWLTLRHVLRKKISRDLAATAPNLAPPVISIVIPYFNQEMYLRDTVSSVKALSYPHVEVIVVDDGSTVSAASVLEGIDSVQIVRTANRGVSAARNLGAKLSSGDYFIFLDADDLLESSAIEAHLKLLEKAPKASMSFGATQIISATGKILVKPHVCRPRRNYLRSMLVSNPVACPGAALISKQAFQRAGGFDERFKMAEDYLLFLRIAAREQIVRHAHCVISYRSHPAGASQDKAAMLASTLTVLELVKDDLSAKDQSYLQHARWRWRHEYEENKGLRFACKRFYCKLHAMMTVPVSAYFGRE